MYRAPPSRSTNSLRVAIDARYVREKPSGIGAYVHALVDRLPDLACSDHFFFWAHPLAPRPLSHAPNTSALTIRAGPTSPWPLVWPQCYASFTDVDVFHSPHNTMPRGLPCASVVTVHDVMAIERPDLHLQGLERVAKRVYFRQAIWRALRQATRLVAQSKATADRICMLLPEAAARLTVIWSAPDACFRPPEDLAAAKERSACLSGAESPYLLVIGANMPSKRLAREDLVTLIQAAGGLIQPSIYEGFGLPVLEAMACGCPVVASDIAPLREITAGAAVLFPAGDLDGLASALRDFVRSTGLRQSLGEQGLSRARDFSWDHCARETLKVYRDAAARRP